MTPFLTIEETEAAVGDSLKQLRLHRNLDQRTLAERADISVRALQKLEAGGGSTVRTLISVVRALGRADWFTTIAPVPSINPLALTREAQPRQRAKHKRPSRSKSVKTGTDNS